jgi:hypothetical protein
VPAPHAGRVGDRAGTGRRRRAVDQWRVVLAEDESLMAQMGVELLVEVPVEIRAAKDGRDALEQAVVGRLIPDRILERATMEAQDH